MATIRKREAWRVRHVDQHGKTCTRQFDLKRDAEAFRVKAEGPDAAGIHTAASGSITVAGAAGH